MAEPDMSMAFTGKETPEEDAKKYAYWEKYHKDKRIEEKLKLEQRAARKARSRAEYKKKTEVPATTKMETSASTNQVADPYQFKTSLEIINANPVLKAKFEAEVEQRRLTMYARDAAASANIKYSEERGLLQRALDWYAGREQPYTTEGVRKSWEEQKQKPTEPVSAPVVPKRNVGFVEAAQREDELKARRQAEIDPTKLTGEQKNRIDMERIKRGLEPMY